MGMHGHVLAQAAAGVLQQTGRTMAWVVEELSESGDVLDDRGFDVRMGRPGSWESVRALQR